MYISTTLTSPVAVSVAATAATVRTAHAAAAAAAAGTDTPSFDWFFSTLFMAALPPLFQHSQCLLAM